ncbi:hypothetical protein TNIN_76581 [Trichonephila inaurata madagascariensis]|uniref:Uncharacterized protein n=1 Tax=Trichonephila inaurata madagascariensis TaxID=2747483 RepID=A0A8X6X2A3_9ARAC|nr:hypothetical protein TNIN_76581 [Trichonephila inaurata madagascariensis]
MYSYFYKHIPPNNILFPLMLEKNHHMCCVTISVNTPTCPKGKDGNSIISYFNLNNQLPLQGSDAKFFAQSGDNYLIRSFANREMREEEMLETCG